MEKTIITTEGNRINANYDLTSIDACSLGMMLRQKVYNGNFESLVVNDDQYKPVLQNDLPAHVISALYNYGYGPISAWRSGNVLIAILDDQAVQVMQVELEDSARCVISYDACVGHEWLDVNVPKLPIASTARRLWNNIESVPLPEDNAAYSRTFIAFPPGYDSEPFSCMTSDDNKLGTKYYDLASLDRDGDWNEVTDLDDFLWIEMPRPDVR